MSNNTTITVRREVKTYLDKEMKKAFINHHPELEGTQITKSQLLLKAMRYYVEY